MQQSLKLTLKSPVLSLSVCLRLTKGGGDTLTPEGAAAEREKALAAAIGAVEMVGRQQASTDQILACLSPSKLRMFCTRDWVKSVLHVSGLSPLFKVLSLRYSEADVIMMFLLFDFFLLMDGDVKFVWIFSHVINIVFL